jgi:hypothetical protein
MSVAEVPQLATDERVIEGASALEQALEERENRKASLGALRKQFREADDHAKALLGEFNIQEGEVARIGRWRISRKAVAARAVSFETSPTSRLQIKLIDLDIEARS